MKNFLSRSFILFLFTNILNLNSIPLNLEGIGDVDSSYVSGISKIIFDRTDRVNINSIRNLGILRKNYSELEAIRKSSGVKNLNKFKNLLSYCQELVDLRKEIISRVDELISTMTEKYHFDKEDEPQAGEQQSPEQKFLTEISFREDQVELYRQADRFYDHLKGLKERAEDLDNYEDEETLKEMFETFTKLYKLQTTFFVKAFDVAFKISEKIGILKAASGKRDDDEFGIIIPDERAHNETIKQATDAFNIYTENKANLLDLTEMVFENSEDVTSAIEKIDGIEAEIDKINIDEIIKKITELRLEYKSKLQNAERLTKEIQNKIARLEADSEERKSLEEQLKILKELMDKLREDGELDDEGLKQLNEAIEGLGGLSARAGEILTQRSAETEEALKRVEELRGETTEEQRKEAAQTDSARKKQEYDKIQSHLVRLKQDDYSSWFSEVQEKLVSLDNKLDGINKIIENAGGSDLISRDQVGLFKKLKESAQTKINIYETEILSYRKNIQNSKADFVSSMNEAGKLLGSIQDINDLENVDYASDLFSKEDDKKLEDARDVEKKLNEIEKGIAPLKVRIQKIVSDREEMMTNLEQKATDVQDATNAGALTDEDKEFIQTELTRIITEESNSACLPYDFKLNEVTERSTLPKDWYVEAGKPNPNIEVTLNIEDSKLIENIKNIEFEQESKNIYTRLLAEELDSLIKEHVLNKELSFVYGNIIVKRPEAKKGERSKGDAIQCDLAQIFDGFVNNFDEFFEKNILDLGIILTHIKSRQVDSYKDIQDEESSSISVLSIFNRILSDGINSLEKIRFYINGLRIHTDFGFKDDDFFKFNTKKGPRYFDEKILDGAFKICSSVSLPFFVGAFFDYDQSDFKSLNKLLSQKIISDAGTLDSFNKLVDSFFDHLFRIISGMFIAEKVDALDNLSEYFILSRITNTKNLNNQIKNLMIIANLKSDDEEKTEILENLKKVVKPVNTVLSSLNKLLKKEGNTLDNEKTLLRITLSSLKRLLKKLNDFTSEVNTDDSDLTRVINLINDEYTTKLKNKHGNLSNDQTELKNGIAAVKKEYASDPNIASLKDGWNISKLKKDNFINYFLTERGKKELLQKKEDIENILFGKISSLSNLFIDKVYEEQYFKGFAKNLGIYGFFKFPSFLVDVKKIFGSFLGVLKTNSKVMKDFEYSNIASFFEPTGLILTSMYRAYLLDNANKFFDLDSWNSSSDYETKINSELDYDFGKELSLVSSNAKINVTSLFKKKYPDPKYFLSLAKKYFEKNKFKKMVKPLFTYFYISNQLFYDQSFRLFYWSEDIELKKGVDVDVPAPQQPDVVGPPPPPGPPPAPGFGPPPPPPGMPGIGAKLSFGPGDIEKFKKITDELFFRKYNTDKESLNKYFVERFYQTLVNFLNLVIKENFKNVISNFDKLRQGSSIKDMFPKVKSGNFNIKNQQMAAFKQMKTISEIDVIVNALNVLKPKIELSKENILRVSFIPGYNFYEAIETISSSLLQKMIAKYPANKGFLVEGDSVEGEKPAVKKLLDAVDIRTAIQNNIINFVEAKLKQYVRILIQYKDLTINLNEWKDWNLAEKDVFRPLKEAERKRIEEENAAQAEVDRLAEEADAAEAEKQNLQKKLDEAKKKLLDLEASEQQKKVAEAEVKRLEEELTAQKEKEEELKKRAEDARRKREEEREAREERERNLALEKEEIQKEINNIFIKNKNDLEKLVGYFIDVLKVINDNVQNIEGKISLPEKNINTMRNELRTSGLVSGDDDVNFNTFLFNINNYVNPNKNDVSDSILKLKTSIVDQRFMFNNFFIKDIENEYINLCNQLLSEVELGNIKKLRDIDVENKIKIFIASTPYDTVTFANLFTMLINLIK